MTSSAYVLVPLVRTGLFIGCRLTLLPWLFGEAKHASLDADDAQENGDSMQNGDAIAMGTLPSPATASRRPKVSLLSAVTPNGTASSSSSSSGDGSLLARVLSTFSPSALLLALSFEEGIILFVLVLMEAMGFERDVLQSQWRWSLFGVVGLAVCLLPLGLSLLLTYTLLPQAGASAIPRRLALSLIPFAAWLLLFLKVPLPSALLTDTTASLLESALARTAVLGVSLIAILSGSGAMGATMDSLDSFLAARGGGGRRRDPSPSDVRSAESSFRKACEDLQRTKREIDRLSSSADAEAGTGGLLGSMGRAFRGGTSKDRELKALNLELGSLSLLAATMRDELDELKARRKEAEYNTTLPGKLWLAIGHAFALYCVTRLLIALLSLLFYNYASATSSSSSPDVLSTLLARWVLQPLLGIPQQDVATWSKQVSLLFVGALILGRLRVVLNVLARFFRAASSGVSTSFLVLFLAEVLVVYLLATLIQLRASLPPSFGDPSATPADSSVSQPSPTSPPLLASLPDFNVVFGSLFDAAFLLSAAVTGGVRYLTGQQDGILFSSNGGSLGGRD
ncbi:hypothetical protein BDZ90DRAFT_262279 [Jaminaea rosea]|uniref:Abscisic acid G-protein coupled receptor-like domain-containing protein n=1 Tax=Jaminaea rosea TaxID=1569628 RepID=A0A316UNZ9_9BASI|nr:hypothetical protein BDZ90DRAFT_262279 [Jaminaea rosea]PWN25633.1 hypothetical protein BDZ90DRAFT_262279 [Jaminaea rosea]